MRTAAVVITASAAFYAFTALPLAQVYAILFAAPLLITVLAIPILGERVGIRRGLAVLVGLGGDRRPATRDDDPHAWPHRGARGRGGGRLASVIMRKIGREERAVVLILYPMMANFVLMGAAMPFVYEPMPGQDLALLAVIAALALIATNLPDLRLPRRPGRDRRADAVLADHLGLCLWRTVLRRGAGMGDPSGHDRSSWPRVFTSSSARIAAAVGHDPGPAHPVAHARRRPPRAWPRSSPTRSAGRNAGTCPMQPPTRGRLMPLHWPCVGAIPRRTVGV
jgi:hypothetical protein